jgi:hypothetical protein
MPHSPKLLPWIARRHGVPRARAEVLWLQALALADFRYPEARETSDYWTYAVRTLHKLMACEGAALVEPDALERLAPSAARTRSAVPIIVSQQRMGGLAFDAAEALLSAANEYWSRTLRVTGAQRRA